MGIIRAHITVGHDDEGGADSVKRAFGRTFKSVLAKATYAHFCGPHAVAGTPYYLPVVQKWTLHNGRQSRRKQGGC
eukprot:12889026-Prorocentrum_lima.AAC.1